MTSTETRGTPAQLPCTGGETFSPRLPSRSQSLKGGIEGQIRNVVSPNSSDRFTVLHGHPVVSTIALQALVDHALSGHPVVYLDGVHAFDSFLIEQFARSRRQQPRKVLAMIHVARAFSARQLERLMSQCLAHALERYQARTAVISGLLETLSTDGLTNHEINRLTDRMIESLRHLTQQGFSLLCPCPHVPRLQAPSHRLFSELRSMSDRCIRVSELQGEIVTEDILVNALPA